MNENRDFENWPLNRGWLLNTGPFNIQDCLPFHALRELVPHQSAILRMAEIYNSVIRISANQEEV